MEGRINMSRANLATLPTMAKWRLRGGLLAALCLSLCGCVSSAPWLAKWYEPAPTQTIAKVQVDWQRNVVVTEDVVNGGRPLLGLAGRMYLLAADQGTALVGDGSITVELCDVTKVEGGQGPVKLERWTIDPATLKRLLQ